MRTLICWAATSALALLVLVAALAPSPAYSHPLKLSVSLIQYDAAQKTLKMECKVFIDDFQLSLINSVLKGQDLQKVKKKDRAGLIESYFQMFYHVKHNGRSVTWKVKSATPLSQHNVLVIRFKDISLPLKKGDRLEISNTMFFNDFGYEQTNRIVTALPAFNIDDALSAEINNHTFSYVLGDTKK